MKDETERTAPGSQRGTDVSSSGPKDAFIVMCDVITCNHVCSVSDRCRLCTTGNEGE